MRAFVADLLCCPACGRFPLDLEVLATADSPNRAGRSCELWCGTRGRPIGRPDEVCSSCSTLDVETGYFFCQGCKRFYFILDGIPRLLTEELAELIDLSLPQRFPEAFRTRQQELDTFVSSVSTGSPQKAESEWNLEDVSFWEHEVYADSDETQLTLKRAASGRRDAGNRAYPRERALFGRLRSDIPGGVMLDLGCGLAQTIRTVCDPDAVGYAYIGVDLSISALRTNRRTLSGDFIQCTADRAPLRSECVDAVVVLGTLHHLADHDGAFDAAIGAVRPGGLIALHEVVARHHLTRRVRQFFGIKAEAESAHNESVDPVVLDRCLAGRVDVLVKRREHSPVRGVLVNYLADPMRSRPWLTKLVLGVDAVCLATLGRLSILFEGRELLLLARKHGSRGDRGVEAPPALQRQ